MIIKSVFSLFLLIGYLSFGMPAFAESPNGKKVEEVKPEKGNDVKASKWFSKKKKQEKKLEPPPMPEELEDDLDCTKDMKYTEAQKKHLDEIYHRIYMDYLELIETYTAAGALTEDQKLVRYSMLKNYILTFAKRNYKWCSEWEEDEWEEEWYNIDRD